MKFKSSFVASLSAFFLVAACKHSNNTTQTESQKLKAEKVEIEVSKWALPNLTHQEKEELVYSVQTVFNDFYVHRTQKKAEYGFDSKAEANQLSADMSSEDLLRKINHIYASINDYHTVFLYPVPARCVLGGFPLTTKLAYETDKDGNTKEKLVIASKLSKTLKTKLATDADQDAFAKLNPGDEILSISNLGLENGPVGTVSVQTALSALQEVSFGANDDAAKTRAAQIFFSRNGAFMKPPSGRFQLTVKNVENGTVQTYAFPWISYQSTASFCDYLNEDSNSKNTKNDKNLKSKLKLNHFAQNNFMQKDAFKSETLETFKDVYADTDEPENIEKKIVEYNGKKFAVVRINAFVPAGIQTVESHYLDARAKIIEEVQGLRKFLTDNKDQVEGLIFDVRDNGGGYGSFPQLIANALTTEFVSNMQVQPLVSQMNRDTFHNLEFARFFNRFGTEDPLVDKNGNVLEAPVSETANEMDAILQTLAHQTREIMLEPAPRFDEDENDELPPEYTAEYKLSDIAEGASGKYPIKQIFTQKPIAVFTNSHCYSSCDIFSSLMKDYKIAKMFGETKHTGGGGANVVEWNSFAQPVVVDAKGTLTPVVPNAKVLPQNIRMRFAWNRIVRDRAEDQQFERYIEGGGVYIPTENVLKPTVNDVVTDGNDAFHTIMQDMIDNASTYPLNR